MLSLKRPTIALLINHFNDYIFPYCVGALNKAAELGADIRVFCQPTVSSEHDVNFRDFENYSIHEGSFNQILGMMVAYGVDGVIVTNDVLNFMAPDCLETFLERNPDIYAASITNDVKGASLIQADNYLSGKLAVEHLVVKHDCTRIMYVRGPSDNEEANDRYRGYVDVLREHNIPFDESLVYQGDWFFESGKEAIKHWLDKHNKLPEAIVAANDNMVYGAIEYMQTVGLSVPKDIKAIGFDNSIYAENAGITSIGQSWEDMSAIAVNELFWRIQNKNPAPNTIRVPCPLVIRRGCGCRLTNLVPRSANDRVHIIDSFSFESFSNPDEHLKSATEEQKNILCNDVRLFLNAFTNSISGESINRESLDSLADMLNQLVQNELIQKVNVSYWADLLLEIQIKCENLQIESEYFSTFFSDCRAIVNGFINSYIANIHLTSDVLAYSNINTSKRLLSVDDIYKATSVSLKYLRDLGADFGVILLFPSDQNLSGSKVMKLAGRLDDGNIEIFEKNKQLVEMDNLSKVSRQGESDLSHFYVQGVVPLGLAGNIIGYFVADIKVDRDRWNALRSLQVYFTQAIKNLELLQERAKVTGQKEIDNLKSDFVSRMTHEMRTPMNGVVGMTKLLQETSLSDEQKHFVHIIQNSSEVMLNLVNEVLDFSALENDKIELDHCDFSLPKLIESLFELMAGRCEENSIYVGYSIAPDVPIYIQQDKFKLQQVVLNVLNNAIKFTSDGYVIIEVSYKKESNNVYFIITNSGEPIEQSIQETIFTPFEQGGKGVHRRHGGTGIGLAVSKRLCMAMGGDLELDSGFSDGARFVVSFSANQTQKNFSLLPWQKNIEEKDLKNREIFLVSDCCQCSKILHGMVAPWEIQANIEDFDEFSMRIQNGQLPVQKKFGVVFDVVQETSEVSGLILDLYQKRPNANIACIIGLKSKLDRDIALDVVNWIRRPVTLKQLYYALYTRADIKSKDTQHVSENTNSDYQGLKMLLAEDNIVNQQVALSILKKLECYPDVVDNGIKALEKSKAEQYDVILMDIFMPEMDGETATKLIKQEQNGSSPYIIAVTANTQKGDREKLLANGLDDYVAKPIDVKQLELALSRAREFIRKRIH